MKLLLTSGGISTDRIRVALEDLLGKPVAESSALWVPTAMYAAGESPWYAWAQLREAAALGWRRFGVLELTTLPSVLEEHWLPAVQAADALVVGGGNTPYLAHWMQRSGFADRLPALMSDLVYVGFSAGSMVVNRSLHVDPDRLARTGVYADDLYGDVAPPGAGSDVTVPLTDFVVRPHFGATPFPRVNAEELAAQAATLDVPLYALDDRSAVKVVDGRVEVVSDGEWRLFEPGSPAS